jgi:hypothetical protein
MVSLDQLSQLQILLLHKPDHLVKGSHRNVQLLHMGEQSRKGSRLLLFLFKLWHP